MLRSHLRRFARDIHHDLFPTPEQAVLRELERRAATEPRRTVGTIALPPFQFEYADAMSAWPQWDEIFLHSALAFDTQEREPRIIDCGSNIGLASLYFKRKYPRARITAFEADPSLAALCARNLAANHASDVQVRNAAVWIDDGCVEFVCEGADSGAIASLHAATTGTRVTVPAERLHDWLNETIDFLKLDIEGAELPVVTDCRDRLHNVRAMTIDLHEFNTAHRQTGAVLDLLEKAGFALEMRNLVSLPWRGGAIESPFPSLSPVWVVTVRAWRP